MLGTRQTDTLCAESTCHSSVVRGVGVGTNLKVRIFVAEVHECLEVTAELSSLGRNLTCVHLSGRTVERDIIALFVGHALNLNGLCFVVHLDSACAGNAALTHTASHNSCVAGHTAACGKDTLGCRHTCEVFRAGLDTNHDDFVSVLVPLLCVVSVEDNLSARSARRSRQTLGDDFRFLQRILVEDRVEQLVQFLRFAAHDSLFLADDAFAYEVHSNLHHGSTGTLAVTGLEEPEFAFLYGELHILHVAVVVLELLLDGVEFGIKSWHSLFHRRILAGALFLADTLKCCPTAAAFQRNLLRSTDTGNYVLTLCVYEVLTVEEVLARRGVTAEAYTGSGGLAHVTEDHSHNGNSGSPLVRNSFHLTVQNRTLVHPAAEYSADSAPELLDRVVREIFARLLFDSGLETRYEELQLIYIEVLVQLDTADLFYLVDNLLERVDVGFVHRLHTQYHVTVHLYETAVTVIYEVRVVGLSHHSLCYCIVQTEVEDSIHHTRHRCARTRAYRNKEWVLRIAELAVHQLLYVFYGSLYLSGQFFYNLLLTYLVVLVADLGGDGESGRNRNAHKVHLRAVSALAAQQLTHLCVTLGFTVTEGINSFLLFHLVL